MTQYPPSQYAPPQNGLGTAGFVLGLVGLVFSVVPIVGVIAWPLVVLGLVLSGIGLARARAGRATNKGIAVAGLVCSALGLVACIGYAAAFGAAMSNTPPAGSAPLAQPRATTSSAKPQAPSPAGIAPDPVTAAPAPVAAGIGEGVYVVGPDIEPGTYRTDGPGNGAFPYCYWARLKDTTGSFEAIIANGNPQGPATVTIKKGDGAFETSGCAPWVKR